MRKELATVILTIAYLFTPFGILLLAFAFVYAASNADKYIFFYGLTFGVIAYCTVPLREIDITRYFQMIDSIRGMSLKEAYATFNDGLLVRAFVFWLVSKTGDNNILPFLSMTTVYCSACYIIVDSARENKSTIKYLLLFQMMLLPFYNVYSNVRNVSAFALLAVALYRDLVKHRINIGTILLYILPCFIHMTGIVIVLLRLVLPLVRRHPIIGISFTLFIPTASILLFQNVRSVPIPGAVGLIVNRAIWKAYTATVGNSDYAQGVQEHGSFIMNRVIMLLFLFSLLTLIIMYIRRVKPASNSDYLLIGGLITSIALIWDMLGIVKFWVMAYMVCLLSPPIISEILLQRPTNKGISQLLRNVMISACVLNLPLQVYRIIKNFDLSIFFEKLLFTNYIVILVKGIYGLLS